MENTVTLNATVSVEERDAFASDTAIGNYEYSEELASLLAKADEDIREGRCIEIKSGDDLDIIMTNKS